MGKFVFCDIKDAAMHTAGKKAAELSFSDGFTGACQISKGFPDRPDKGFEQLKRWISCASFESIVLKDLELSRLGKARDSFLVWIKDHSSSPDFPCIVFASDSQVPELEAALGK